MVNVWVAVTVLALAIIGNSVAIVYLARAVRNHDH